MRAVIHVFGMIVAGVLLTLSLLLASGFRLVASTWWERLIEMPLIATLSIIVLVYHAYSYANTARKPSGKHNVS